MVFYDKVTRGCAIGKPVSTAIAMESDLFRQIGIENRVVNRTHYRG